MKKKHLLIICIISSLNILTVGKIMCQIQEKYPVTYMIMIDSPVQEQQANVLIKSIYTFGGCKSPAPVVIVLADTLRTRGESLEGIVMEIVKLRMNESLRGFPFSDKVFACAQVEKIMENRTEWLVWLNPDALVVAPPSEIMTNKNAWASLRPVHIKNVGLSCTDPVTDYWKIIYQQSKVDTNSLWCVESFVDKKTLRPYYNSGCMAFRPDIGILREWKMVYESMLCDKKYYAHYSSDSYGSFFFHQAVLSAVLIKKAGKDRINILPPSFGYPLSLQNSSDFINKMSSIAEMKIILCENYENLEGLVVEEPYGAWINTHCTLPGLKH